MEIQLEIAGQGHTRRLVIVQSNGERIEGKWVNRDATPTLDCRHGKLAWIGGRPVSLEPVGIQCSSHPLRFLVGNNYCHECADRKRERNRQREERKALRAEGGIDLSKLDIDEAILDIDNY